MKYVFLYSYKMKKKERNNASTCTMILLSSNAGNKYIIVSQGYIGHLLHIQKMYTRYRVYRVK